jgi:hypothetical protein
MLDILVTVLVAAFVLVVVFGVVVFGHVMVAKALMRPDQTT